MNLKREEQQEKQSPRMPRIEPVVVCAWYSCLKIVVTDLLWYVNVSKVLDHACSFYLDFILTPVSFVIYTHTHSPLMFRALDYFISEPNGSVSVFTIAADNHHAEYSAVTIKQLVHMRKYIRGHDYLSLEEMAVEVLFGSSSILGWMESFGLYSEFQYWKKKNFFWITCL